MKILVTGGSGFIGGHLVERLIRHRHAVRVLDRQPFTLHGKDDIEIVEGDITDPLVCDKAARGIDVIVHLAAMSRSGPSEDLWEECVSSNVLGTGNVARSAIRSGCQRVIYAGSATYYGDQPTPSTEDLPPDPKNPYALSKWLGEETLKIMLKGSSVSWGVLRLFSVYGPRQPRSGPYGLVMGIFAEKWRSNLTATIYGSGHQSRDFIHVKDVCAALELASSSSQSSFTLNVGSGSATTINSLAEMFNLEVEHVDVRSGDSFETLADISRTQSILNWAPTVDLHTGIKGLLD